MSVMAMFQQLLSPQLLPLLSQETICGAEHGGHLLTCVARFESNTYT